MFIGGTAMLALNIYSLICACIGFSYGLIILLKYDKTPPLYFKLLVFAIASQVFTRAFYTVALLCYGDEPKKIFNIGFLGFGTFFMFIYFVNVGEIDNLVDPHKKRFTKYRLIPVILPTVELIISLIAAFSDHASLSIRFIYVLLSLFAGSAGYFNLKHLIIFDVKGGKIDSIRKFNLMCIVFEILILSEVGLYCYNLENLTIVAEILIGIMYIIFLPVLYKGVKKWNQ